MGKVHDKVPSKVHDVMVKIAMNLFGLFGYTRREQYKVGNQLCVLINAEKISEFLFSKDQGEVRLNSELS